MSRPISTRSPNPPHRHHYIPSFYLSRWAASNDGKLCQYSRPYDRVVPHRRYPAATGYVEKLYELSGLEGDKASALETKFFKPVDNDAADALALMEAEGNRACWDYRRRLGWAVFLHSLLLRAPEDVSEFKKSWRHLMNAEELNQWDEHYHAVRKPGDAMTLQDHMANLHTDSHDRSAMSALVRMINNRKVAERIRDMLWHVIDTSDADFDLLTSDRPIIMTDGLMIKGGHLALPIGPRKLFVAARDAAALNLILAMSRRQLVRECNRQMCDYAVKFVYGVDDSQLLFVGKHFATKHRPRFAQASDTQRREMAKTILAPPKSPWFSRRSLSNPLSFGLHIARDASQEREHSLNSTRIRNLDQVSVRIAQVD